VISRDVIIITITAAASIRRKFENDVYISILNAISESVGRGHEYNLNLIDDPGATLANITTITHLSYLQAKQYLQILADQGLVIIQVCPRRRRTRKKGREIKKRLNITTFKVTDEGYRFLQKKQLQLPLERLDNHNKSSVKVSQIVYREGIDR
jgi:predicted transcriptional regulator